MTSALPSMTVSTAARIASVMEATASTSGSAAGSGQFQSARETPCWRPDTGSSQPTENANGSLVGAAIAGSRVRYEGRCGDSAHQPKPLRRRGDAERLAPGQWQRIVLDAVAEHDEP